MRRRDFIKHASMASAGLTIINFPIFGKNAPSNKVAMTTMANRVDLDLMDSPPLEKQGRR